MTKGFAGFSKEALDFLNELRANNCQEFYDANRERYERVLKEPLRVLCEEVSPVVRLIDPRLDVRPGSVMSRIRRDTRFTRDKSPYRDHVWLGWRYPGERRSEGFHMFWGFGADWLGWGCGSYGPDKPLMDALRQTIRREPDRVRDAIARLNIGQDYQMFGEPFRRMTIPKDVPADLAGLYGMKYFGAESLTSAADWDELWSHACADRLTRELERMAPLLQLMTEMRSVDAQEEPLQETVRKEGLAPVRKARSADEFEF